MVVGTNVADEMAAKSVHEVLMNKKIADGWSYGDKYSESEKTTPYMIPYDDLRDSDKDYDRYVALMVLNLVIYANAMIQA